ncbi:hypothetical protein OHB35_31295 [Streptomyces phaeochromogenes]|uniref:Uncharacterized protein n=1 Tax=Streptomyces phaeochromogenes TaxID=1923 RepID=A0ABZ1HJD7_STRPH|nr:hypothetical protein [Streptomyces phaeochromogenes]WSD17363.1 hypothetical protein OHB35_31295 [Streptomyces phaeochromogenes]
MTTVTLPTVSPPPGRYAVAPGRSFAELTAYYGPLATLRRRVTLTGASLTVPETESGSGSESVSEAESISDSEGARPVFRFDLAGTMKASLVSEHVEPLADGRHLQLLADLDVRGVAFPVLLRLRVVRCAEGRMLVVGSTRLPYRLLRRATGFRLPWSRPATRLRLLLAAEFA